MRALSIRQPWAWLIIHGGKDIENRSWRTHRRGRIWVHASSKAVTAAEYEEFSGICRQRGIRGYPAREDFKIGGIVGSVEIVDCVTESRSFWFGGEYGFVLKNARLTRFRAMKGRLGFFEVDTTSRTRQQSQ